MIVTYVVGVVLLLLLVWGCGSVRAQVPQTNEPVTAKYRSAPSDLYALQQLWNAWNSTPDVDNNLAGWNSLSNGTLLTPCAPGSPWQGVFCTARPNTSASTWDLDVVELLLPDASLTGTIPAGIGNLSNLVTLSLAGNSGLTGPLPKEMENLYSLFNLDLHGNSITGTIPNWKKDSFVFIQNINLGYNKMTGGMPENETSSFRAVQTFNISHNLFSGDFGNMIGILDYFHKAVSVDFSHNSFSGNMPYLVSSIDNSTSDPGMINVTGPLSYFDISSNKFDGRLSKLSGHKTLQFYNVSHNQLTGSLNSEWLTDVPTLKTMDLSNNLFTDSIPNLAGLASLQHLDLSYNNFNPGPFPNWTTDLSNLHTLILQGVSLTGGVPASVLAAFKSLQTLALDDNNLTGTLDLDSMLAVPSRSQSLQLVSITNNRIDNVAYSDYIVNLKIKLNLMGNPYCDNSTKNDLTRCICLQWCVDTVARSTRRVIVIATAICGSLLTIVISVYSLLFWRTRKERYQLILGAEQKFAEYEVKPTIYTFSELQVITRHFSMKLGHGGFGAVYKGALPNGSEVAVKQLHTKSQQSLDEFLNEIVLVAAVKHRNLVKLKGCCIRTNQRLLVYEYVQNGDLEQFLFGPEHIGKMDNWSVRKNICYGVAEGIHYLHCASQPKIIHRDIKACNILLDTNMEPKIADFGLALLYPQEESHIMTIHVAGTRGYLAPEYAHLGHLSEKVDVFSFGVLLLEIVSKRRNMRLKSPESDYFYLPDWAWSLLGEGRIKELIDPTLELQPREETEALRIINVALMCVHSAGERRPDMKAVLAMLHGGMDTEVAHLVLAHQSERFRPLSVSLNRSDASFASSSVMTRGFSAPRSEDNQSTTSASKANQTSGVAYNSNHDVETPGTVLLANACM